MSAGNGIELRMSAAVIALVTYSNTQCGSPMLKR